MSKHKRTYDENDFMEALRKRGYTASHAQVLRYRYRHRFPCSVRTFYEILKPFKSMEEECNPFTQSKVKEIIEYNRRLREIDYTKKLSRDDIETIVNAIYPWVGFCVEDVTPHDVHQFRLSVLQYKQSNNPKNK